MSHSRDKLQWPKSKRSALISFDRFVADKLPYSIRILLESAIRNCDNFQVTKEDVEKIIDWEKTAPKQVEIPFKPARVLLQVNIWRRSRKFCLIVFVFSSFHFIFFLFFGRTLLEYQLLLILLVCVML